MGQNGGVVGYRQRRGGKKPLRGHREWVFAVAFSPDGKKVLTGSLDNTAKLWDEGSGAAEKTFTGHTFRVTAVAFSPDGKNILTGSKDQTAKLWDVRHDAIEDKIAPFSFYALVQAGFQLDEEDMGQYRLDSITFVEKNRQNFIQYHFLMDSLAREKGLIWDKTSRVFREKSAHLEGQEVVAEQEDGIVLLQNQIAVERDTLKRYALYGQLIDSLKKPNKGSPGTICDNTGAYLQQPCLVWFFSERI